MEPRKAARGSVQNTSVALRPAQIVKLRELAADEMRAGGPGTVSGALRRIIDQYFQTPKVKAS